MESEAVFLIPWGPRRPEVGASEAGPHTPGFLAIIVPETIIECLNYTKWALAQRLVIAHFRLMGPARSASGTHKCAARKPGGV